MSKREDKFYPSISINSTALVREDANGYRWIITTHVSGPDEIVKRESKRFTEKSKCTMDMMCNFSNTVALQLEELFK
jgi:hypothetical protein